MKNSVIVVSLCFVLGCGSPEIKPVEIYPEDICSSCRMAFSDERFAAEIVFSEGDVAKFDDIGCMVSYRNMKNDMKPMAVFLRDYDTRHWISADKAIVVETNIMTPMGSGKIAFSDSTGVASFMREHPAGKEE